MTSRLVEVELVAFVEDGAAQSGAEKVVEQTLIKSQGPLSLDLRNQGLQLANYGIKQRIAVVDGIQSRGVPRELERSKYMRTCVGSP